jgi:hypothetical protein
MKARTARFLPWSAALSVVLSALYSFAGEACVSLDALVNQSQAPATAGAFASPACISSLFSPALAPDAPGRAPTESPLPPPVPEEELFSSAVPVPPVSTGENSVPTPAAIHDDQKALQAAFWELGTHIEGLLTRVRHHGQQLEELSRDVATLTGHQQRFTKTIAAILASGVVLTLSVLGIVIVRVAGSHPPTPLLLAKTTCHGTKPVAPVPARESCALPDIHMALSYLSTPKHEDRIASASCPGLHVLVVADGASSYRGEGVERSGGGAEAAALAVKVAITYLTDHLHPALGLTEALATLTGCFATATTALEKHNGAASIPGATTLLIAALWQERTGRWYWLSGNIGDGVLTILHTSQLLSGWPLATPLLSKQSNGTTTITLPGYAAAGIMPSLSVRPRFPGDMLLIGSDGLLHLDTVTKHTDHLSFHNYLWTQIRGDRPHLSTTVHQLPEGRTDAPWQNALTLDDTTLGILWS